MQVLKLVSLGRARHIVKAMSKSLLIVTHEPDVPGSIPGPGTYFSFFFRRFKKGCCQLLAKVCARSTGYRLGGLRLPRKSVAKLTDRPDMTMDVYRGRKTTTHNNNNKLLIVTSHQHLGHTDLERFGSNSPPLNHYILEFLAS